MSNTLKLQTTITFPSLGNKQLKAKVDTGATTSSMHATNIVVKNNVVQFQTSALSANNIRLQLAGVQDIKSADSAGQTRPVVVLDVVVGGQQLNGVQFNLVDRGDMDALVLLGQNLLKQGGFSVDASEALDISFGGGEQTVLEPASDPISNQLGDISVEQAIGVLVKNNVSFSTIASILTATQQ